MRRIRARSRPNHLVCPTCGHGELRFRGLLSRLADCDSCECAFDEVALGTLKEIVALPESTGTHACEDCGHPEMRCLPDGVFHCPACRSEVLPIGSTSKSSAMSPRKSLLAFARTMVNTGG